MSGKIIHEREGIGWDVLEAIVNDPGKLSPRAKALLGCKGKRGCDFARCVKKALGAVPYSVRTACPTLYPEEA